MDSDKLRSLAAEAMALAEKTDNPEEAATLRSMARGLLEMADIDTRRHANNGGK